MDDLFDKLVATHTISKQSILEAVDEYLLYCFYLGFEPDLKIRYKSPIREDREDTDPSFSLFENWYGECEYRWKDSGLGITGDIFSLVRRLYNLPGLDETLKRIDDQRKIGFHPDQRIEDGKIIHLDRPKEGPPTVIKIISQPFTKEALEFWAQFHITEATLKYFNVTQVKYFWMHETQEIPLSPSGLGFAYREIDKYKIYQPHDPEFKFRNNYPHHFIEGFFQLKYQSDTLIITKSKKDVMLLFELGYEAVSPKSENTMMPKEYFKVFEGRYKYIYVLFDNDMKHKGDEYPFPKIYVPEDSGEKDITDYAKRYGKEATIKLMKELTIYNNGN